MKYSRIALILALMTAVAAPALAHHSLAMYDTDKTYTFTGVVTGINPSAAHLIIHFVPLDEGRTKVMRDENGEPEEWSVEMDGAAVAARTGVTVNNFPPGTIISVGLHPLRNGGHAGARGNSGLYQCPRDTPPEAGKFCDSVAGSTAHGKGDMPKATGPAPLD